MPIYMTQQFADFILPWKHGRIRQASRSTGFAPARVAVACHRGGFIYIVAAMWPRRPPILLARIHDLPVLRVYRFGRRHI